MTRINNLVQVSGDPSAALYVLKYMPNLGETRLSECARAMLRELRDTAIRRWTGIATIKTISTENQVDFLMGINKLQKRGEPANDPRALELGERKKVLLEAVKRDPYREALNLQLEQMRFEISLLKEYEQDDRFDLNLKMRDPNPMIRWLAVVSASQRRQHCEDELINRLKDPVPAVRAAAHDALVRISRGTDFGPAHAVGPTLVATRNAQDEAVARWRQWLKSQREETPAASAK